MRASKLIGAPGASARRGSRRTAPPSPAPPAAVYSGSWRRRVTALVHRPIRRCRTGPMTPARVWSSSASQWRPGSIVGGVVIGVGVVVSPSRLQHRFASDGVTDAIGVAGAMVVGAVTPPSHAAAISAATITIPWVQRSDAAMRVARSDREGVPLPAAAPQGGCGPQRPRRFARAHHGLVTRVPSSGRAGSRTDRGTGPLDRGQLECVPPRCGRMFGAEPNPAQTICAAVLAAGRGAMASHRSAAWLWGIPRPAGRAGRRVDASRAAQPIVAGAAVHRPRDLLDLNPVFRQGIPTTNILRTLCDLGARRPRGRARCGWPRRDHGAGFAGVAVAAIERHERRGRPGVPALRVALSDWVLDGKPVDSVLEPAMRRLSRHRLPPAEFHPRDRRLRGRLQDHRQPAHPGMRRMVHARARP